MVAVAVDAAGIDLAHAVITADALSAQRDHGRIITRTIQVRPAPPDRLPARQPGLAGGTLRHRPGRHPIRDHGAGRDQPDHQPRRARTTRRAHPRPPTSPGDKRD
ncbi:MAG: hypothetical protein JO115_00770 [Pseudonocardiales bacterium]|nr:hypothetical protein [Pseudonocardiales bacterium]